MPSLSEDVLTRYDKRYLTQLTRPGDPNLTEPDQERIDKAAADVQADFRIHAGVIYLSSDNRHVTVAVPGVIAKLIAWLSGPKEAKTALDDFFKALESLSKVQGRDRGTPVTSSRLDPSDDEFIPGRAGPQRPKFDRERFRDTQPNPP